MNSFRTEIFADRSEIQIDFTTPVILMGSCFANHMGNRLCSNGFRACTNPFGVLYNPITIIQGLDILLSDKKYTKNDLGKHNDLYYSFDHYTGFSHPDQDICLHNINTKLEDARSFMKKAKILVVTLGTSWAYAYKKSGRTVANCHKIPAGEFDRFFVESGAIVGQFANTISEIKKTLPEIQIIFTVSPIRHWKDGAAKNQLSKANLIVAVHQLIGKINSTAYFPSYEIMMDDLRGYRFYESDMLHPNETAIDYIWQKFIGAHIEERCSPTMKEVAKLNKALNHRPTNPGSKGYVDFIRKNIDIGEGLQQSSGADLSPILNELDKRILNINYGIDKSDQ